MTCTHRHNQAVLDSVRAALYDGKPELVQKALGATMASNCLVHMCHPIGDHIGANGFFANAYVPLFQALPDLERRDWIVISGEDDHGHAWVGCAGHYVGTFAAPFLEIPPSGHFAHMRFHEFYRFENDKIVEVQAIWDIPELMMQAGAWPMAPSLGREMFIPGPATSDGVSRGARDADQSRASQQLIIDMLEHMIRHPKHGGPDVMELPRFWHEKMNWYGPAGIGVGRGTAGFRNWHQIPFLAAMPDRGSNEDEIIHHFFADNAYCAVTGWPNMAQTITGDGWMGIAPSGQKVTLRSLDFWRIESNKIRENWVLVDLLDLYNQIGVDVLARMGEFNKARMPSRIPFPIGDA